MQDDLCLSDYNVEERLADFVAIADEVSSYHQGQDIMLTMGDDWGATSDEYALSVLLLLLITAAAWR